MSPSRDYSKKGLTVYSSAQHPFMVRHDLAEIFDLPLNAVRIIVPFVGGGYGSKSYTKIEPIPAVCSWRVGRPVKLQLSVEEAFLTTRGDDARVRIRTACDAEGRFLARQATIHLNTGAYAENSPLVCAKAANRIIGPYLIPNVDIDCYAVYTNTVPASSYRGIWVDAGDFSGGIAKRRAGGKTGLRPTPVPSAESGAARRDDLSGTASDRRGCAGRLAAAWRTHWLSGAPCRRGAGVPSAARRAMPDRIR